LTGETQPLCCLEICSQNNPHQLRTTSRLPNWETVIALCKAPPRPRGATAQGRDGRREVRRKEDAKAKREVMNRPLFAQGGNMEENIDLDRLQFTLITLGADQVAYFKLEKEELRDRIQDDFERGARLGEFKLDDFHLCRWRYV
jgi:hypothetical protein